jgi:DNA-binding IclR family transcriptional regulator
MKSAMKAPTTPSEPTNFQAPALDRALTILELLAKHPGGIRMREIAEKLDLPSNAVFRITGVLEQRGYLLREKESMRYFLSRKLLSLGYAAIAEGNLIENSLDVMRHLRDETGETVLIGVRAELQGVVLERIASNQPVKFLVDPGTHFPLHASAPGKVLISFLPGNERKKLLEGVKFERFNERTLNSKAKFKAEIEKVVTQGYGIDCAEQIEGLHCVGAPIFDHRGYPMAALWVTGPSYRFPEAYLGAIGTKVIAAATQISQRFGYKLL